MHHAPLRNAAWTLLLAACASSPAPAPAPGPAAAQDAASPVSTKPVFTPSMLAAAEPQLEAYVRRVLGATQPDGEPASAVELVQAHPFEEGHVNETWYLAVDVDGVVNHAALKIFADGPSAVRNAAVFREAHTQGWPVPTEIARDETTRPYADRPSLLMEFVVGGSLRTRVEALFRSAASGAAPAPQDVADLYGEVGDLLGYLHARHLRPRRAGDGESGPALLAAAERCAREGWCDGAARGRLTDLAGALDEGPVTFCHGDLYESQVITGDDGRVKAFVDLDEAGWADPASDVGALLGHVVLLNPVTRAAAWGIPDPSPAETKATARQLLLAYRARAGVPDDRWPGFLRRVRAHAWLRLMTVMERYRGNPHARALIAALDERRAGLVAGDPFAALDLP